MNFIKTYEGINDLNTYKLWSYNEHVQYIFVSRCNHITYLILNPTYIFF